MDPSAGLSRRFRDFARLECRGSSPLYERLSVYIASDEELLALAARARNGQPTPNLFFAAVHFLLLRGAEHPLAAFYESLGGAWGDGQDPCPAFKSFCTEYREEIAGLIATRMVQTNAVKRCSCLLPAFAYLSQRCAPAPLALVEVGTSAGLNLMWDRYGYDYGGGRRCGDAGSPVQLFCRPKGALAPPLPYVFPDVKFRVGIDLLPVPINDPDALMWLRALVWPEHRERMGLLGSAVELAWEDPPKVIKGNAVEVLPELLPTISEDFHLCLYHTHTLNKFTVKDREAFHLLIDRFGRERDLDMVSMELGSGVGYSVVELTTYNRGTKESRRVAECDTHGAWVEWLIPDF